MAAIGDRIIHRVFNPIIKEWEGVEAKISNIADNYTEVQYWSVPINGWGSRLVTERVYINPNAIEDEFENADAAISPQYVRQFTIKVSGLNISKVLPRIFILLLILCSCNAEKRAHKRDVRDYNRLKARGYIKVSSDTIWNRDTVKGWQYDTVFYGDTAKDIDTFWVKDGGNTAETIVKWKTREVIQKAVERDTVYIRPETVNTTEIKEPCPDCKLPWWAYLVITLETLAILGLVFRRK